MSEYLTSPSQFAIVPIPMNANLHNSVLNWFYANPEIAPLLSRNYSAETQYKSFVDTKAIFPDAKTIAVVINPWARMVRAYYTVSVLMDKSLAQYDISNFESFLTSLPTAYTGSLPAKRWFNVRQPQHMWTETKAFDGSVTCADYIIKAETATQDFAAVQQFFNSSVPLALPTFPEASYHSWYNDTTKAIVADIYKEDIARFGYTF